MLSLSETVAAILDEETYTNPKKAIRIMDNMRKIIADIARSRPEEISKIMNSKSPRDDWKVSRIHSVDMLDADIEGSDNELKLVLNLDVSMGSDATYRKEDFIFKLKSKGDARLTFWNIAQKNRHNKIQRGGL